MKYTDHLLQISLSLCNLAFPIFYYFYVFSSLILTIKHEKMSMFKSVFSQNMYCMSQIQYHNFFVNSQTELKWNIILIVI